MFTKKTFEDVFIRHFKELTGEDFRNLNIPIKIGVMHKTRGYFSYSVDEKCTPLAFKFSTILLDGRYKDEDVIKIIRHEIIHYIVLTKYGNVPASAGFAPPRVCRPERRSRPSNLSHGDALSLLSP